MIIKNSLIKCADNSGAKELKVLYIYKTKIGKPGGFITVVLKRCLLRRRIRKGQICKAIIVRMCRKIRRINGIVIYYLQNAAVILRKHDLMPAGTRIKGSVFYELRFTNYSKIVISAAYLL